MAKDGTNRGGVRVGAGKKRKPLEEKILEGKADSNVFFNEKSVKTKIKPPKKYLNAEQKVGVAQEVVKIKLHDAQITAEQVTFAKVKLGELLAALPTQSGARTDLKPVDTAVDSFNQKPKAESIAELGITQKQAERLQQMAKNPEAVQSAYDRSILALKLKPVIAAKAKEQQIRKPAESVPKNSCEQTEQLPQTEKRKENRQRETNYQVAQKAGVSEDTIRKVEKIEQQAAPEIKAARAEKILRVRPKKKTGGKIPPYLCRILGGM